MVNSYIYNRRKQGNNHILTCLKKTRKGKTRKRIHRKNKTRKRKTRKRKENTRIR